MVKKKKPPVTYRAKRPGRWRLRILSVLAVVALGGIVGVQLTIPKMAGTNVATETARVAPANVQVLYDVTGLDQSGERIVQQSIFEALLTMIEAADDVLVLDMFLVNTFRGYDGPPVYRNLTGELVKALVAKKQSHPDIWILFITDPINSVYGHGCPPDLQEAVEAGVNVVVTDLEQLPDCNLLYSSFFRLSAPLLERLPLAARPLLANPFDPGADPIGIIQYLRLLNFKANHRKVAVVRNRQRQWQALVTSANPHTASSSHGNAGVLLSGPPARQILDSELRIARSSLLRSPELSFSQADANQVVRQIERHLAPVAAPAAAAGVESGEDGIRVQYLSEAQVGAKVDGMLDGAVQGDTVQMMMFYLSDPAVLRAIRAALQRGVTVRLLLDPNKDAFGRQKNGIPNRSVARDLTRFAASHGGDLQIRWFATHGEQAHFKLMRVFNTLGGREQLLVGSANFTVRNLRGSNLESAVYLQGAVDSGRACGELFARLWGNSDGGVYSVGYERYASVGVPALLRKISTTFGNLTGFCTY